MPDQGGCQNSEARAFCEVGKGQRGTVFAMNGTPAVFKAMNPGKRDQLANDFRVHLLMQDALRAAPSLCRTSFHIPQLTSVVGPSNLRFWKHFLRSFPQGFAPTYGIVSGRIGSPPLPLREAIFGTLAPKSLRKNRFFALAENNDCLVRLYLGRRALRKPSPTFKLRNLGLMVNEIEGLQLDSKSFACAMAHALALMHWGVGIDANQVKFVLGSAPSIPFHDSLIDEIGNWDMERSADHLGDRIDFCCPESAVWLFDFDQCKEFSRDAEGLKQLVRGFFSNDPYYPRPGSKNQKDLSLWDVFKRVYLMTSRQFTGYEMPEQFLDAVEKEAEKRSATKSLFGY